MRLSIIVNPNAGKGRACKKLDPYLSHWPHKEWDVTVHPTSSPEDAGRIAEELLADAPDLLAVCGGDGTFNHVMSHVPSPPFPIAILPGGTANVLAREIGLPLDPLRALDIALKRAVRRVDVGLLKARQLHRFLLMAGVGFDAYVTAKVGLHFKRRVGMGAYYLTTLRCLLGYHFTEFQLTTESGELMVSSCLIANARSYGGGLILTPEADMSDGVLDVLALEGKSKTRYLRFILSAWRGRPAVYPWLHIRRARAVKVEGPRGIWVHVDGEPIGTLPLEISLAPASFPLVVKS